MFKAKNKVVIKISTGENIAYPACAPRAHAYANYHITFNFIILLFSRLITHIVYLCIVLIRNIDCKRRKTTTAAIHSSSTSTKGSISSCAVFEEGVPLCNDPEDTSVNDMW